MYHLLSIFNMSFACPPSSPLVYSFLGSTSFHPFYFIRKLSITNFPLILPSSSLFPCYILKLAWFFHYFLFTRMDFISFHAFVWLFFLLFFMIVMFAFFCIFFFFFLTVFLFCRNSLFFGQKF